jgi:hypothetical protein
MRRGRAPEAPPAPPSERRRHRRVRRGDPPAPFAVTLDDAAPRQSAKPHGNRTLFALGCLRPLDDASFGIVPDSVQERPLARRFFHAWPEATVPARTRARRTMMGGVGLQPLSDLVAHGIRPVQDRVDSVAQRAKLSPVHRLSPLSGCAILQIGCGHPLVKFVDLGLEVLMGSTRSTRRRVAAAADSMARGPW